MDEASGWARRYHWLGESVDDFVSEPHESVQSLGPAKVKNGPRQLLLLNMVAKEAEENRAACAALTRESPDWLLGEIERLTEGPTLFAPARHPVLSLDVNRTRLRSVLRSAHEQHPQDFETLLGLGGVGEATLRSLSLLAEIIFQAPPSHREPQGRKEAGEASSQAGDERRWADYSYAHGGKDGTPFPVDRSTYDRNIEVLSEAVRRARVGDTEKLDALRRLARLEQSGR